MPRTNIDLNDLPALKPRTHCVLMPRDPDFIYAYWDYIQEDIDRLRNKAGFESDNSIMVLRIYDITGIRFNGSNANHKWDIEVGFSVKNWYVHVWQDNADYCAELGIRDRSNHFITLTRSNSVRTPPKSASQRDDLIWQDIKGRKESMPYLKEKIKEKKHHPQKIYKLSPQDIRDYYVKILTRVSPRGKFKGNLTSNARSFSIENILRGRLAGISWEKVRSMALRFNFKKHTSLGASLEYVEQSFVQTGASELSLGASEFLSGASEIQLGGSEGRLGPRKFFFEVWTELIVYGRTEPDAAVWLNEKGIKLNPDGTFSLRYALPDGEVPLKFIAQSSDGVEQRHINTRVEREKTTGFPKMLKDPNGQ